MKKYLEDKFIVEHINFWFKNILKISEILINQIKKKFYDFSENYFFFVIEKNLK